MQDTYPGTRRVDLGSRGKSEVITIRISPKAKFALEIMARMQGRTAAQTAESAILMMLDYGYRSTDDWRNGEHYFSREDSLSVINKLWSPHRGERMLRMVFQHPELLVYEEEVVWNEMTRAGVFDGYLEPPISIKSRPLPDANLMELEDRVAKFLDDLDAAARAEAEKKKSKKKAAEADQNG
jgi:hypothetical protein